MVSWPSLATQRKRLKASSLTPLRYYRDTLLSTIVREMAGTLLTTSSSICTECCIFQFGLGSCGASTLWDGIVRDPGCNGIWPREQALGFPGIQGVSFASPSLSSPLLFLPRRMLKLGLGLRCLSDRLYF